MPAEPAGRGSFLVLAALALVVALARAPGMAALPVLSMDDGRFLAQFVNPEGEGGLLFVYAGYVALLTNAAFAAVDAAVDAGMPLPWVPWATHAVALAASSATLALFALPRFAAVLPDARLRAAACAALVLLPIHTYNLLGSLTFVNWSALLAFVLLGMTPFSRRPAALAGEIALRVALVWSHPLCLALAPAHAAGGAVAARAGDGRQLVGHGAVLAAMTLYLAAGLARGPGVALTAGAVAAALVETVDKVGLETVLGVEGYRALRDGPFLWPARLALVAAVGSLVAAAARRPPVRAAWPAAYLLYAIAALTGVFVLSRPDFALTAKIDFSYRYVYVQKACLVILLVWAAWRAGLLARARIRAAVAGLGALAALLQTTVSGALYAHPFQGRYPERAGAAMGVTGRPDDAALAVWEWERQRRFLAEAEALRHRLAPGDRAAAILERGDGSVRLVVTGAAPR